MSVPGGSTVSWELWTESMLKPAVFLDRDGTINHEVSYLSEASQLCLIDGAAEGIRRLNQAGLAVVVVTNQAGVARGLVSESALGDIHRALEAELHSRGAALDAIYYCPHHPSEGAEPYRRECDCRKPKAGMFHRAAQDLALDLERSYVVGDKLSDLRAGRSVGCRTVLVRTGYGREQELELKRTHGSAEQPHHIADDLFRAAEWIMAQHISPCNRS